MKAFKKLKAVLAVSALVAVSGIAQAAYITPQGKSSTVVLTAFDTVLNVGYVRDMGVDYTQFVANLNSGNTLAGMNVADDGTFTTIFASSNLNDVKWNITAGLDLTAPDDRLLTSAADNSTPFTNTTATQGALGNMSIFLSNLNGANCAGAIACTSAIREPNNPAYFWGDGFNSVMPTFSNAAAIDDASVSSTNKVLDMFLLSLVSSIDPDFGNTVYFANTPVSVQSFTSADLKLSANGTLSAVPLPAAVWLFGTGLIGFVGIGRRRRAA